VTARINWTKNTDENDSPMKDINLSVTLWPSFPHFEQFAFDPRISSIRLNSAMMSMPELDEELKRIEKLKVKTPLYYDIKGRQLRITKVIENVDKHGVKLNPQEYLDIRINHPIEVDTPAVVLFKAGADHAMLHRIEEDGTRLIFLGGPKYNVKEGESIHIRDESLIVSGPQFTDIELEKIEKVKAAGFKHWFLSYVESQEDVDEFIKLVGKDAVVNLKIENKKGIEYVKNDFVKRKNLNLVAARGDLYVEIDRPHEILSVVKLIVDKDPDAIVGSRILLSVINDPVPSCADFHELAWLTDIGYKHFLLCDELCLRGDLLGRAVNVFDCFRNTYGSPATTVPSRSFGGLKFMDWIKL
jgi:pyruvate kinase